MIAPVFRHAHRVTYADCTVGNHVYYGRYLELLEAARGGFFRELGVTFQEWQRLGVAFPVVECRLRYRAPARYDDELVIEIRPAIAGRAQLSFDYRVLNQADRLVLEAQTFHVCAGLDEKPQRLPERLSSILQPYLRDAAGPPESVARP